MPISDKLTYLNTTKQNIKESLNKFGVGLTNENTFRSYVNALNDIYNLLPKVTGNGNDFILENAQNGKLDLFEMEGNATQNGEPTPELSVDFQVVEGKQNININSENMRTSNYEVDLTLQNIKLAKIRNYKDKIYKNNNHWYLKKQIKRLDMCNFENWGKNENGKFYIVNFSTTYEIKRDTLFSNIFVYDTTAWSGDGKFGITSSGNLWITTGDANLTSGENVPAWLSNKNAYMYGILATPQIIQITNQNLINQLEAISTYKGTNIFEVSNENNLLPTINVSRLKEIEKMI